MSAAELRARRRTLSRELRDASGREVLAVASRLIATGDGGKRFIAYELILFHPGARELVNETTLKKLGAGMQSWDAVDTFASYVAGPAWREKRVSDAVIRRWTTSPDRWWRRAALVSTVPLNNKTRGGSGDPKRTLDICGRLIADRDDMVVKAMSWALRELAKRDAPAVRRWLAEHEGQLAARVIREVNNKLRTGRKG